MALPTARQQDPLWVTFTGGLGTLTADQGAPGATPWPVTVVSGAWSANTNVFGTVLAPFNTETNIISYTVPVTKTLSLSQIEVWGDYFAEYFVKVNGVQKGGTNLSCAERARTLTYPGAINCVAGDLVTVSVTHQAAGAVKFSSNLMGSLT